jgi:hypothetical protein
MKMFWLILLIDGHVTTQTPLGYTTLKACNEYAARQMMLGPTEMMARATYRCEDKSRGA